MCWILGWTFINIRRITFVWKFRNVCWIGRTDNKQRTTHKKNKYEPSLTFNNYRYLIIWKCVLSPPDGQHLKKQSWISINMKSDDVEMRVESAGRTTNNGQYLKKQSWTPLTWNRMMLALFTRLNVVYVPYTVLFQTHILFSSDSYMYVNS